MFRRRRHSAHPAHIRLQPIHTFRDAVATAADLSSRFRAAHAVLILGDDGVAEHLDLLVGRTGDPFGMARAWASSRAVRRAAPCRCIAFSVGLADLRTAPARDLERFVEVQSLMAARGIDLLDWIQADGGAFRSLAFATDPARAWPADPPGQRERLLALMADNDRLFDRRDTTGPPRRRDRPGDQPDDPEPTR